MAQEIIDSVKSALNLSPSKKVLLLGAGFVVAPTIQILSDAGVAVTIACRTQSSAEKLSSGYQYSSALALDVDDTEALNNAVSKVDLVISLIPYIHHHKVLKSCIKNKVNLVTTSYVSQAQLDLEDEVKAAGIVALNEIGLDPGIDHLWAVKLIDEVHRDGGKIESFHSYCGGLVAPENSDNPLGYRFSWSPRGVLLALRNTANFWKDGKKEQVDGKDLMKSAAPYESGFAGFSFMAYANRDSTIYKERYSIPEAETVIRGTLRYPGFTDLVQVLVDMGFLSDQEMDFLKPSDKPLTWAEATAKILSATSSSQSDLEWAISSKTKFEDTEQKQRLLAGLRWIGVFSDNPIKPGGTPLDTLCAELEQKMKFEDGQRDFVFLQHKFGVVHKDGKKETIASTLVEYGEPQGPGSTSAMSKLVGVPCGVAALMVLNGKIKQTGVIAPLDPELASALREELKPYGIEMKEKVLA